MTCSSANCAITVRGLFCLNRSNTLLSITASSAQAIQTKNALSFRSLQCEPQAMLETLKGLLLRGSFVSLGLAGALADVEEYRMHILLCEIVVLRHACGSQ